MIGIYYKIVINYIIVAHIIYIFCICTPHDYGVEVYGNTCASYLDKLS